VLTVCHLIPRSDGGPPPEGRRPEEPCDGPQAEDRPGGVANRRDHGCETAQTRQKPQVHHGPREALPDQTGKADAADPDTARDLVAAAETQLHRVQHRPELDRAAGSDG
jgi:hypothetical protein